MPDHLILISRPINFLFALEVVKRYKEEKFIILIYPNSNVQEINACNFLLQEFRQYFTNAEFICFISPSKNEFINLHYFNIWLYLKFRKNRFKFFSTSGGVKGRIAFKHTKPNKLLLTDEGVGSLKKFPEIFKNQRHFPLVEKKFYKRLYKSLGIFDIKNSKEFKVLTLFENLQSLDNRVEYLQMSNWKLILQNRNFVINNKEIIVLGSVPQLINMEYSTYIKKIEEVFLKNQGMQIWYKPHKNFMDNLGFPELKTELPIEYFFLQRNSFPERLYSFGSTSNTLLNNIYPEINTLDLTQDL